MDAPTEGSKAKRGGRTVDYGRTDKRPHSFRYKRGTTFVPREGEVKLAREADGVLVIGPSAGDSTPEAATYEGGQVKLVAVKKRANGKQAITFEHETLGTIVAYDARSARAVLRAG